MRLVIILFITNKNNKYLRSKCSQPRYGIKICTGVISLVQRLEQFNHLFVEEFLYLESPHVVHVIEVLVGHEKFANFVRKLRIKFVNVL